jgi:hypothetical protein
MSTLVISVYVGMVIYIELSQRLMLHRRSSQCVCAYLERRNCHVPMVSIGYVQEMAKPRKSETSLLIDLNS